MNIRKSTKNYNKIFSDTITPEEYVNKLKARKASKNNVLNKIKAQVDPNMDPSDQLQVYFDALVPRSGKAKTVAGELVRAMMRILYRDFNDGDVWYSGYGRETCGSSVMYLVDMIPGLDNDFEEMINMELQDSSYSEALEDTTADLIIYLNEHPELFTKANTKDSRDDYDYEELNKWFTLPTYEFDVDASYEESYYDVSDDEIDDFINSLVEYDLGSGSVNRWASDAWVIEELDKEDYDMLNDMWEKWFRNFLSEHEREEEYEDDEEEYEE